MRHLLDILLHGWATSIYARYGHPVYLVGSALQLPETAGLDDIHQLRDVDVVCVLPDREFFNRFCGDWAEASNAVGLAGTRWALEMGKQSRWLAGHLYGINADLKVQSEAWVAARHADRPRRRIDTAHFPTDKKSPEKSSKES